MGVFLFLVGMVIVYSLKPSSIPDSQPIVTAKNTSIIVLPHHDLILDQFSTFYSAIQRTTPVKKIIFLSPNHFQPESTVIKTTNENFILSDEISIAADSSKNFKTPLIIDNAVFVKEHGVLLHLPFIKKYFPEATIFPLLLTRNISKADIHSLVTDIQSQLDENTLLIISTDFSHYLSYAEAEKKDQETLSLINEQKAEQILSLSDDYLDCPACMYVAVRLQQAQMKELEIIFHGNSAQYLQLQPDQPTTSYFVIRW